MEEVEEGFIYLATISVAGHRLVLPTDVGEIEIPAAPDGVTRKRVVEVLNVGAQFGHIVAVVVRWAVSSTNDKWFLTLACHFHCDKFRIICAANLPLMLSEKGIVDCSSDRRS